MSASFAPVGRRSLADDVRRQFEMRIRSGTLRPGARLPSEGTLCAELGVSRDSVRAALRDLVLLGLVERRGSRVYVVEHLPAVRIDADQWAARVREVFETRRLIELQLTEWAAERATAAQRAQIAAIAAQMAEVVDLEALRPLDRAFHAVIAAASGNALLAELHTKVLDAVFATPPFGVLHGPPALAEAVLAASAAAHAAIAAAVSAGDGEAAAAAAAAHLDDVAHRLLDDRAVRSGR
jgi:DNA-binding FadR family transcriptional regulator